MNFILKILFSVLVISFVVYSFMIALRTRIVANTVKTEKTHWVTKLTYLNVILTLVLGAIAVLLIATI